MHPLIRFVARPGRRGPGLPPLVRWPRGLLVLIAAVCAAQCTLVRVSPLPRVEPNDNRTAAGSVERDTLRLALVVRMADWRPESDTGPALTVAAIAEEGKAPQIPSPLIRVRAGMSVHTSIRNALRDSSITVIGLTSHPSSVPDTLRLRPRETKVVRFAAGAPGSYLYRVVLGRHEASKDDEREQLGGAFIVDPAGGSPNDRVFVINIWSQTIDATHGRNALAINGRSWPWNERISATVGDTLRWRVVNASNRPHPMHLHGAYYLVGSKGDALRDTAYAAVARRLVVTEVMDPYQTMAMSWTPEREGNWLFHCHIGFHVVPEAARVDPTPPESHHGAMSDPRMHMAGLVLGIEVSPRSGTHEAPRGAPRRLDLFVQESARRFRAPRALGFVQQRGSAPPAPDSVEIAGSTLVMTKGEPTDVVVHNRLRENTAIHWHGIELESYSDGVVGWSGAATRLAPPIAAGSTFVAHLTLRRAGTFIYHTHLNDLEQLTAGLYGAIVVLEPGRKFDPRTDHVFVVGWDGIGAMARQLVNGDSVSSPPLALRAGEAHRLRFINIGVADPTEFAIRRDSTLSEWRALAKDGADLPAAQATRRPARVMLDVGETYDFAFRPSAPGEYVLSATVGFKGERWTRRLIVR